MDGYKLSKFNLVGKKVWFYSTDGSSLDDGLLEVCFENGDTVDLSYQRYFLVGEMWKRTNDSQELRYVGDHVVRKLVKTGPAAKCQGMEILAAIHTDPVISLILENGMAYTVVAGFDGIGYEFESFDEAFYDECGIRLIPIGSERPLTREEWKAIVRKANPQP